jgi:hypothetical protein
MKLIEWIESEPFQYTKVNVRPWGSYELQISIDGRVASLAYVRGWGWKEKDAFEDILTEVMKDVNFHQNLKSWLGDARFNRITTILNPQEVTDGEGDRTQVSGEVQRLEENDGRPSEGSVDSGILGEWSTSSNVEDGRPVDDQGKDEQSTNPS